MRQTAHLQRVVAVFNHGSRTIIEWFTAHGAKTVLCAKQNIKFGVGDVVFAPQMSRASDRSPLVLLYHVESSVTRALPLQDGLPVFHIPKSVLTLLIFRVSVGHQNPATSALTALSLSASTTRSWSIPVTWS